MNILGHCHKLAPHWIHRFGVNTRPGFTFTPRGKVQAKGKGGMAMYFVEARLPEKV